MERRNSLYIKTLFATLVFSPITLQAQTAPSATSALLEELVVTARKREQNLQAIGAGVSLLSGREIAQAQLRGADDLGNLIPALNVQASSGPSTSSFNIRGIGTRTFSPGVEPSVSTMLDGVVMGRSGMAFFDLVDVERVEVLRGPQGTLYGKNASGGVIHVITADPAPELEGRVSATAIEEHEYRLNGTVSGPITDEVGYRLTGSIVDDGGYSRNLFEDTRVNGTENYNLRGKLLWNAREDVELLWVSDYSQNECECTLLSIRGVLESPNQQNYLGQLSPVVPSASNQDVNNDQLTFSEIEASGHSLTLNWELENHVLTSISAYREWSSEGIVDLDNLPSNPIALSFPGPPYTDQEQFSQELRLASSPQDWGSYVIGAYYFEQEVDTGSEVVAAILAPIIPPTLRVSSTNVSIENLAVFGEVNFNITDSLELILGGRYTQDDISYATKAVGTDNLVFPADGEAADSLDDSDFSEKIALQWSVDDQRMLYASYVAGYKGPAFDTSLVARDTFVQPETSDAFEVGLKSTWLDGRLVLNIAAFYAEYTDFQAEASVDENFDDQLPGNFLVVNAGEVTTKGLEMEFISRPTDDWALTGGIAYTDGTIEDFPRGNCSGGQRFRGECPLGFQDLSGGELPYTPKWKLNLASFYTIARPNDPFDIVIGANLRAQSDILYELSQDEFTRQDKYAIVDF
ncbi:MAG: TonB-dependent receptor, partial [Halioglobus sp.]